MKLAPFAVVIGYSIQAVCSLLKMRNIKSEDRHELINKPKSVGNLAWFVVHEPVSVIAWFANCP